MKLRRFTETDREDFLEMCTDFYQGGAALETIPRTRMETSFQQAVSGSPYIQGFILEEDGVSAGYGIIYPFYSNEPGCLCLMLEEIYVKPAFRGKGLGGQYLDQIADAFGPGVGALKLEVCPHNEGARKLYENHGFRMLGYQSMVKGWPDEER